VRRRILILGGTGEGRELARRLNLQGYDVITSLAGATAAPLLPEGSIRRGGFGGSSGLEEFLRKEGIALVIDATHPFAVKMSLNGSAAAESSGIGFLRLERPAWSPQSGDRWIAAKEIAEAALLAPSGARIFLSIGHKEVRAFLVREDLSGLLRSIEPPGQRLPTGWALLLARPPFTVDGELSLMRQHRIDVLVSKNSGGEQTAAKLAAARQLQIPVIMVERPRKAPARTVASVDEMVELVPRCL
jgi:precorrin-6A/cobalt-precorrin-6A reductase